MHRREPVFALILLAGLTVAAAAEPMHEGKPLSAWTDDLLAYSNITKATKGKRPAVAALREIGTNAIPWLLKEMVTHSPPDSTNQFQHQNRARFGFWAIGAVAAPAIPDLLRLLDEQPDFVPWALAGIGAPALPALEFCLTNAPKLVPPYLIKTVPGSRYSVSALAGLCVSLQGGRISQADAAYLEPVVRRWATDTDRTAAYWARGVLRQLE